MKRLIKKCLKTILPRRVRLGIYRAISGTLDDTGIVYKNMYSYLRILKEEGYNPSLIIDVGAYQGQWTLEVLKIFPSAKFLMVEPQSSKESILKGIADGSLNIKYKMCLLGDTYKEGVKFFEMETGSSIYKENTAFERKEKYLTMYTLDDIVTNLNSETSIFLKLDVQGAERDVLEGAKNILTKVDFLLLELSTLNYNANAPLFAELIAYLDSIGFVLFDICDERRKANKVLFQVDMIFANKSAAIRKRNDF